MINHYTSTLGFESILSNQTFRFTRADFLNDPQDCSVFFTLVNKYLDEYSEKVESEELEKMGEDRKFVQNILEHYPIRKYMEYVRRNIHLYVMSFTKAQDALPMWNYYGGEGIQIGLDEEQLLKQLSLLRKNEWQFWVCTEVSYLTGKETIQDLKLDSFRNFKVRNQGVKYTPDIIHEQGDNLKFFVDSYIRSYMYTIKFLKEHIEEEMKEDEFFDRVFKKNRELRKSVNMKFKFDIDLYMLVLAAAYKPDTYQNEEEVRIVYFEYEKEPEEEVKYQVCKANFGSYIRPYLEIKLPKEAFLEALNQLCVSPVAKNMPIDAMTYRNVIQDFVQSKIGKKVEVRESKHSIRW